jgi:class 3 adenylate cyclase/predicted ATPase
VAEGERKTITMLFADLADSTALIHDIDAEDARSLIDSVLDLMMEAVHHYEGYVAKSLGDGILALFGAPIACEDHAQRALYAALRMQEAMREYAESMRLEKGVLLQIRIGVHTGEVVVRSIHTQDLHTDYDPVGASIHIASRMETVAPAGSIIISEHTHKLTEGYFELKALGTTRVKGVPEPMAIYEVLGVGSLQTKFQMSARRGLVGFVGRQHELKVMQQALARASAGHGQIIGVVGEPGVGKSRLFHEFKRQIKGDCRVSETFSVSHGKAFACLPLIGFIKHYCQIIPQDDENRQQEKVRARVVALGLEVESIVPYLCYLLGIVAATSPLLYMDPQTRRLRIFEALKNLLVRESLEQPLVLLLEDLQWLDSETQCFLDFLGDFIAANSILLLTNYRPEYHHDWGCLSYYSELHLEPLAQLEADEFLVTLLGNGPQLVALARLILERTEGNPFFIEEVVQTLVEEQVLRGRRGHFRLDTPPASLDLPVTVQGVLAARMDRLDPVQKELLQILAVIGRGFVLSLVKMVTDLPGDELLGLLSRLQSGEFIYQQLAFPELEYCFKHGVTQEVAYNSLLNERRRMFHERTARAIEALFEGRLEERYAELAYHYGRSGNTDKAIEYLQLAGQQAVQRYANAEAIDHINKALTMLGCLPANETRDHLEMSLLLTLGPALMATRGYAAPEVESTYNRALVLCRELGNAPQLFPALLGLRTFYHVRGRLQTARELGEQLLTLAREVRDPALLLEAHRALGTNLFNLGELTAARGNLEDALALYSVHRQRPHVYFYGVDSGVFSTFYMAWVLWYQGYPDQALKRCDTGLALARELSYPIVLVVAQVFAAECHFLRREPRLTQQYAQAAIALSVEHGFPLWNMWGTLLRGWALVEQGACKEGIAQMRLGLVADQETGAMLWRPYFLSLLVEALGKAGQVEEGLDLSLEALDAIDASGARIYEAELHRLRGELLLARSGVDALSEAQACFRRAIRVARGQGAKSLELRATISLCRVWQCQGEQEAAIKKLSRVHAWFHEGMDTEDLQASEVLLAELEAGTGYRHGGEGTR